MNWIPISKLPPVSYDTYSKDVLCTNNQKTFFLAYVCYDERTKPYWRNVNGKKVSKITHWISKPTLKNE